MPFVCVCVQIFNSHSHYIRQMIISCVVNLHHSVSVALPYVNDRTYARSYLSLIVSSCASQPVCLPDCLSFFSSPVFSVEISVVDTIVGVCVCVCALHSHRHRWPNSFLIVLSFTPYTSSHFTICERGVWCVVLCFIFAVHLLVSFICLNYIFELYAKP